MSTQLITQDGKPSKAEANIRVAIAQGRITPEQAEDWRDEYLERGYEATTRHLLKNKPTRQLAPSQSRSYSEAAWDEFATRCHLPGYRSGGYSRSVV
jgi:hypothetical protein